MQFTLCYVRRWSQNYRPFVPLHLLHLDFFFEMVTSLKGTRSAPKGEYNQRKQGGAPLYVEFFPDPLWCLLGFQLKPWRSLYGLGKMPICGQRKSLRNVLSTAISWSIGREWNNKKFEGKESCDKDVFELSKARTMSLVRCRLDFMVPPHMSLLKIGCYLRRWG